MRRFCFKEYFIWKAKISFTELFHEAFKKQFRWKLMLANMHYEIHVKLVFYEILWNKVFTVYPCIKKMSELGRQPYASYI